MSRFVPRSRLARHFAIALLGVLLFHLVSIASGKLADNRGLGWDGESYAAMVTGALADGRTYPQSRPLLVLVARIPYRLGLDIVTSFELLNYVYAFALYVAISMLLERYGAGAHVSVFVIGNLALCISTSKMFGFYPVLIDLGALAVTVWAFYLARSDRLWAAGVMSVLAVSSREFGVAAILYGAHRAIRIGRPWNETAVAYLPGLIVLVLIRWWVSATNVGGGSTPSVHISEAVENLKLWGSPPYVLTFIYWAVVVFGGISALLVVRARWCVARLWAEPELITFLLVIVGLAAAGNLDIWRYLAFSLPVAIVLIAQYWQGYDSLITRRSVVAMTLVTLLTQRPFERMATPLYFRDWFPLYPYLGQRDQPAELIAVWALRLASGALCIVALFLLVRSGARPSHVPASGSVLPP